MYIPAQWECYRHLLTQWPEASTLRGASLVAILFRHPAEKGMWEQLCMLRKKRPSIPVVIVGKKATHSDIIEAFRFGAADFLRAPFTQSELLDFLLRNARRRPPAFTGWFASIGGRVQKVFRNEVWKYIREKRQQRREVLGFFSGAGQPALLPESNQVVRGIYGYFLGPFEVSLMGEKMNRKLAKKNSSLLAYLVYHHNRPAHRDLLMDVFWPYSTPDSARNSLNSAIYNLRKFFGKACSAQEAILYHNECYSINPELEVVTDADQFYTNWKKARNIDLAQGLQHAVGLYNRAVALYRGDFLEGMRNEGWCEPIRDNLRETYLMALDRLSLHFLEEGASLSALNLCQKILSIDPCLEEVHQRAIICYSRMGLRDKAIRQFMKCSKILERELGLGPSGQTIQLFREVTDT